MKAVNRSVRRFAMGASLVLGAFSVSAQADTPSSYPDRPISIVVGYPAGGSTDLNGRLVAEALAEKLGGKVVVENLGGAGGAIGAQKVVRAEPDGYTLLVGAVNEVIIAGLINSAVKYDGVKDLYPLGMVGDQPLLLAASKESDIKNADDFVKMAKSGKSDAYSFGSSGVGTALHLAGEMINTATGAQVLHIPYKGVAPLVTDLISGQLNLGMFVFSSGFPQVQSGKIIPIGVTSVKRSPLAPEVPALAENPNFKGVDVSMWFGLFGPNNMPEPVVRKLKTALGEVLADPVFQEKYKATGGTVILEQPDLSTFFAAERDKYKKLVDMAGIGIK
ncbi:MAG TPA: tripartite tricarboxylate transporter substrate binding protein [Eoetvoesiella sp.]